MDKGMEYSLVMFRKFLMYSRTSGGEMVEEE